MSWPKFSLFCRMWDHPWSEMIDRNRNVSLSLIEIHICLKVVNLTEMSAYFIECLILIEFHRWLQIPWMSWIIFSIAMFVSMASFLIANAVQFEALPHVKELMGPAVSVILGVLLLVISGNYIEVIDFRLSFITCMQKTYEEYVKVSYKQLQMQYLH